MGAIPKGEAMECAFYKEEFGWKIPQLQHIPSAYNDLKSWGTCWRSIVKKWALRPLEPLFQ